jgi:hypothetical protein
MYSQTMLSFFEVSVFTVATITAMECEENELNFDE